MDTVYKGSDQLAAPKTLNYIFKSTITRLRQNSIDPEGIANYLTMRKRTNLFIWSTFVDIAFGIFRWSSDRENKIGSTLIEESLWLSNDSMARKRAWICSNQRLWSTSHHSSKARIDSSEYLNCFGLQRKEIQTGCPQGLGG